MTELITTQPAGIAAILAALGFLITSFARLVLVGQKLFEPVAAALSAWTKRTLEERDCAPKLAEAVRQLNALRVEFDAFRLSSIAGGGALEHALDVVETRDDEPTGDQRLPTGISPRRRRDTR